MFCPQCGKATNPTMNFCPYCSFPLKNQNENFNNADNIHPANKEESNPDNNLKFNIYNDESKSTNLYEDPSPSFKFDNSQNPSFSSTFDNRNNQNNFNQTPTPQKNYEQQSDFQNQQQKNYSNNEDAYGMPPQNKNNNQFFNQSTNANKNSTQNNTTSQNYNSNVNENDFQNKDYNPFDGYQLPNQNQTNVQQQPHTTNNQSSQAYTNRIPPQSDSSQQNLPMATNIYSRHNHENEKHPLFPDDNDNNDKGDSPDNYGFDFEKREPKKKHFYTTWPFIIVIILILCASAILILNYFGVLNIFTNKDNNENSSSSTPDNSEISQDESSSAEPSNTNTNPSADDKVFYLNLENTTFEEKFTGKIYTIDDEIIVDGTNILAFDGNPESKADKLSYKFSLDDLVIEENDYKQIIVLCSIENRTKEEFYLNPFYITLVSDKGAIYKPNLKENTSVETVLPDKLANGRMIYDIPNSDDSNLYIAYSNSENLDLAEFFIRI